MRSQRESRRSFFLAAECGPTPGRSVLLLDVHRPQRLIAAGEIARPPRDIQPCAIIRDGLEPAAEFVAGGNLLVARGWLWSLLDPCQGQSGLPPTAGDPLTAEQELRTEGRRLWCQLSWWRTLSVGLRSRCRETVAPFSGAAAEVIALLDELAGSSAGNPFDGWPDRANAGADSGDHPSTADATSIAPPSASPAVRLPADPEALAAWLVDPQGLGRFFGPGFVPRGEQAEMLRAVAAALAAGRALLVEAGTGVGKTLAYLVPLLQQVVERSCRAVVATHTRTLQAQIIEHDLPLLARLLPEVRSRLLMGRRNYLCRRQREAFLSHPVTSLADAMARVCLRLWLVATVAGRRDELAHHPVLRTHLGALFDSALPCAASLCYEQDGCFVQKARREARQADLLVVNHSLLLQDFAGADSLLGPFALLVVDEAHHLPQVALETHTVRCDARRLAMLRELVGEIKTPAEGPQLLRELAALLTPPEEAGLELAAALQDLSITVQTVMRAYHDWWTALSQTFQEQLAGRERPQGRVRVYDADEAFGPLRQETRRLLDDTAAANAAFARLAQQLESWTDVPAAAEDNLAILAQLGQWLTALQKDVRFLTGGADENWVLWLEPATTSGVRAVGATRLEAGDLLREYWRAHDLAPVMTSATLAVGEDFSHHLSELGLRRRQPPAETLLVASPFDYARQALFLTVADIVAPDHPGFASAVTELLGELLLRVPRKTLALFTSYQLLQSVALDLQLGLTELRHGVDAADAAPAILPELLVQSQAGGAPPLLESFRQSRSALLLGTTTFWEGVDFPGSDLELLVVTRLPFLVPTDPWVEARCERIQAGGENPFTSFMVRDAILRLRQGLGRLIRRDSDRGVVILLDNRLHTKSYGASFLAALPAAVQLCADRREVAERAAAFFQAGGSGRA